MTCKPDCPLCGGYGRIYHNVPTTDPLFGKAFECPNHIKYVWDDAINITQKEAVYLGWETFNPTTAVKKMKKALIPVLERGFGWVYIYGDPGVGKTIMSKSAIIKAAKKYNYPAYYTRMSEMMNNLRASYSEDKSQIIIQKRMDFYNKIKVLAVDEIGRDRPTEFAKQSMSEIMDARYNLAVSQEGITIWISNFSPEETLEPYQVDRVRDGRFTVLHLSGKSVRTAMKYPEQETEPTQPFWWQKD